MKNKKEVVKKTVFYGLFSIGLYAAFFSNAMKIATIFAKGGWYAIYPIATVFLFSFVHGTFASNVWSSLGIEPKTIRKQRKVVKKKVRPRLRVMV